MRPVFIISAAALLFASSTAAVAEDNDSLPTAGYVGTMTGIEEKDTFGFDPNAPSDLQVRFKSICSFGAMCPDEITTGALQAPTNARDARYYGPVTGDPEKDTFAH